MGLSWVMRNRNFSWQKLNIWAKSLTKRVENQIQPEQVWLKSIPSPTNMSSLQVFLGYTNYYIVFILNMYFWRAPLNNLLKTEGSKWNWTAKCQKASKKIKKFLTLDLFLSYFDPKLKNNCGISAIILNKHKMVL